MHCLRFLSRLALCVLAIAAHAAAFRDAPFLQDIPHFHYPNAALQGATFEKLVLNRDGIAYVLTDRGVARLFEDTLALDRSFRPLADRRPVDLAGRLGQVYYLYDDRFLSNDEAGKPFSVLPQGMFRRFAVADDGAVFLASSTNLAMFHHGRIEVLDRTLGRLPDRLLTAGKQAYTLSSNVVYRLGERGLERVHTAPEPVTCLAFRGQEMLVGTRAGFYGVSLAADRLTFPLQSRLPWTEITCLAPMTNGLWVGTTRGAFFAYRSNQFDYYASRRWLTDDAVVDLQPTPAGDVFVLTRTALNRIEFRPMTLAQKAAHFDRKIRQRHLRFGFCAELRLARPGDPTSAEMIDTDNDGSWSSYYLASQAFRFGATGDDTARRNAWETFVALERLQSITPLDGFPARTFERFGFKVSDPDRWRTNADGHWEWKGHTSSDEITAQTFALAVLYETTARTDAERARIATLYDRLMSHVLRHNLTLVDVDSQPTLWGRWNPAYVNGYPHTIVDRRLNSAEIVAMLQFAFRLTAQPVYRERALELLERHGYLQNLTSSMSRIAYTPGYIHQGNQMGDEWNHSDDLLAFVTYWVLHRYAFSESLRQQYAAAIRDHWDLEQDERCPLFNFIAAATGVRDPDYAGALWTLRQYPLDLVAWTVRNSHRRDLTPLPQNFRRHQLKELLPPDERPVSRWNGHPFVLDGGDGGTTELAGDEFLLPYWMARYLRLLE